MKVLANDGISKAGADKLKEAGHELLENKVAQEQLANFINEHGVEVLLVRSATKVREDLIDACPGLKMVGRGGVGMDNIDVVYAREKGIEVFNTPSSSSDSVAELVFAHLFGMVRFLYDSNRQMPLEGESKFNELKKAYGKGSELRGKTMGIIGYGRIGQATARIALGLGMKVIFTDPEIKEVTLTVRFFDGQLLHFRLNGSTMEEVLSESDFISLHVPFLGKPLIGADELSLMKPGAGIVNAARGGVIDEEALMDALDSGHLAYAALDVFENEPTPKMKLLMHPQLSLSPHIGAATGEAQERIGEELAERIIAYSQK
jgi:D-3-phosphoglycerate dehydrogenase